MTDLGTLSGSSHSEAKAINNSGQIAGAAYFNNLPHAVLWQNGGMTDLGLLNGLSTLPRAINDSGQIVGDWQPVSNGDIPHAFLYGQGQMRLLDNLPDSGTCYATAINNAGEIVGWSDGNPRAVLWQNGVPVDLNTRIAAGSGWVLGAATGINDQGQICGSGMLYGTPHIFLLTPQ